MTGSVLRIGIRVVGAVIVSLTSDTIKHGLVRYSQATARILNAGIFAVKFITRRPAI
jgi:hypothetical protein